jgi:energy-coupling factor transporter ATP-binding protein EcfA2
MEEGAISFFGGLFLIVVGFVLFGRYVRRWWGDWREYQDYVAYATGDYADEVGPLDDYVGAEPASAAPLLTAGEWLRLLNDQPDQVPHVLIAGKSGSGKTTLARALLAHRRGEVVVLHPKNTADDWHPLAWHTVDSDGTFTTLAGILGDLYAELQQRPAGALQLTVVLDDVSAIAQDRTSKASYQQFVRAAARLGRSKRVRLLMLAHETTAQAVGLPGEVALLENFSRVNVERHSHRATLEHADDHYLLDTRDVPREARRSFALDAWQPATVVQSLRADATPIVGTAMGTNGGEGVLLRDAATAELEPPSLQQQIEQQHNWGDIARLIQAGATTQTKALAALGYKASSTNPRYAAAREALQAALAELEEVPA